MRKNAWKPSSDPKQQEIRLLKSQVNKSISEFIDDLIQFKKLMNGWSSKFYAEKSFIKDPMPADPTTIIGSLANDFSEITRRVSTIIDKQRIYSETRKKREPKSASQIRIEILKEASNPISRSLSRVYLPFGKSATANRFRVSLLNIFTEIKKDLFELEGAILSSDKQSVYKAKKLSKKIIRDLNNAKKTVEIYKSTYSKQEINQGDEKSKTEINTTKQDNSDIKEASSLYHDFINFLSSLKEKSAKKLLTKDLINDFENSFSKVRRAKPDEINQNIEIFNDKYNKLLDHVCDKMSEILKEKIICDSFEDLLSIVNEKISTAEYITDLNIKLADNSISKFLKKIKQEIFPGTMGAIRIEAYNRARQLRNEVDNMLNNLEKELNITNLEDFFSRISDTVKYVDDTINLISDKVINEEYYKDLKLDEKDMKYLKERTRRHETSRMLSNLIK